MTQRNTMVKSDRHKGWTRFKLLVSSSLEDRFSILFRLLRNMWCNIIILRYKWQGKKLVRDNGNELDADRVYQVDPERILYCSLIEFTSREDKGKIIGGGWDRLEKQFDALDVYIALKERFIEGKGWQETLHYRRILEEIRNGIFRWGLKNNTELDEMCSSLDSLFQNIKTNGLESELQSLPRESNYHLAQIDDEITVNIGRYGDLLLNAGTYRLAMAKLLGIPKVPVRIIARHPEWVKFRNQIVLYARTQPHGKLYQTIAHPDLQDLASFDESTYERFNMIKGNLSLKTGRLLDIGAHWGYFCHKFEELGFDCYAVENDPLSLYFLKKIRRAEGKNFRIVPESIFKYQGVEKLCFDVVLALNIFHHFLKRKTSYVMLCKLLGELAVKEMYFQPHLPNEPQMEGAYKNYSEEEFVEFILNASRLSEASLIGKASDGRSIYKLF